MEEASFIVWDDADGVEREDDEVERREHGLAGGEDRRVEPVEEPPEGDSGGGGVGLALDHEVVERLAVGVMAPDADGRGRGAGQQRRPKIVRVGEPTQGSREAVERFPKLRSKRLDEVH